MRFTAVCTKFVSATKRHFGARRYARNRLVWLGDANRRLALGIPSLVGMHEMTWSSLRPSVKFMKLSVYTPQFYVNFSVNLFRSNVFLSSCLSLPLDDKMDDNVLLIDLIRRYQRNHLTWRWLVPTLLTFFSYLLPHLSIPWSVFYYPRQLIGVLLDKIKQHGVFVWCKMFLFFQGGRHFG